MKVRDVIEVFDRSSGWPGWLDVGRQFRYTSPDGKRGVYEVIARIHGERRSLRAKRIAEDLELALV